MEHIFQILNKTIAIDICLVKFTYISNISSFPSLPFTKKGALTFSYNKQTNPMVFLFPTHDSRGPLATRRRTDSPQTVSAPEAAPLRCLSDVVDAGDRNFEIDIAEESVWGAVLFFEGFCWVLTFFCWFSPTVLYFVSEVWSVEWSVFGFPKGCRV